MNAKRTLLTMALAAAAIVGSARALEVEEVEKLSKAGVGEEVILEKMRADGTVYRLSTYEILKLKEAGVSDRVLRAMLATASAPAAPAPEEPAAPPVVLMPEAVPAAPLEHGSVTLTVENLDRRDYSVQVDELHHALYVYHGTGTAGRVHVPASGSQVLRLAPGTWTVRWVGAAGSQALFAAPGAPARLVLTRTETAEADALYVSIFSGAERTGGGRLTTFRYAPPPPAPAPQATTIIRERVVERVPERTVIVERPATRVYQSTVRPSYRRTPYRYSSRHHRDRSLLNVLDFGYSWRRGRSRYAIGVNGGNLGFRYGRSVGRGTWWVGF